MKDVPPVISKWMRLVERGFSLNHYQKLSVHTFRQKDFVRLLVVRVFCFLLNGNDQIRKRSFSQAKAITKNNKQNKRANKSSAALLENT